MSPCNFVKRLVENWVYQSFLKMTDIREFIESNDNFSEASKRFMALTRTCPHHAIPS